VSKQSEEEEELRERYQELLEEVRVVLPGVQVLFAFLLTSPFSSRFPELDAVGERAYAVALVATAASTIILVAPTAYHRIAPRKDRRTRLQTAVRLVVVGLPPWRWPSPSRSSWLPGSSSTRPLAFCLGAWWLWAPGRCGGSCRESGAARCRS
jgi:hypothetical protein